MGKDFTQSQTPSCIGFLHMFITLLQKLEVVWDMGGTTGRERELHWVESRPTRACSMCVFMYSTCASLTEPLVVPDLHSSVVKRKDWSGFWSQPLLWLLFTRSTLIRPCLSGDKLLGCGNRAFFIPLSLFIGWGMYKVTSLTLHPGCF